MTKSLPTRAIPLNEQALQLLAFAQKPLTAESRISLAAKITSSLLTQIKTETTWLSSPVEYIINRLIKGIAASHGGSRINFATILSSVIRALKGRGDSLSQNTEKDADGYVLSVIERVYLSNKYDGVERERVLGILGSIAALAQSKGRSSQSWKNTSATLARIINLLSQIVSQNDNKWIVGEAAVQILKHVLDAGAETETKHAAALIKWCKARKGSSDGLALALILYDQLNILDSRSFRALYPNLEAICSSLANNGSSSVRVQRTKEEMFEINHMDTKHLAETWVLPLSWQLTLDFTTKREHQDRLKCKFAHLWEIVVERNLILGVGRGTQKIMALELVLLVIAKAQSLEDASVVLSSRTAALLVSMSTLRKVVVSDSRTVGVLHSKNDEKEDTIQMYANNFFSRLKDVASSRDEFQDTLIARILTWFINEGTLIPLAGQSLRSYVQCLDKTTILELLAIIIDAFARPRTKLHIDKYRISLLTLLSTVGEVDESLSLEIAKVILMYGLFSPTENTNDAEDHPPDLVRSIVRIYQTKGRGLDFSGVLPSSSPVISDHVAEHAVSCLFRLLIASEDRDRRSDHAKDSHIAIISRTCEELIHFKGCALRTSNEHAAKVCMVWSEYLDSWDSLECERGNEALINQVRLLGEYLYLVALACGEQQLSSGIFEELISTVEEAMEKVKVTSESFRICSTTDQSAATKARSPVTGAAFNEQWVRVLVSVALMPNALLQKAAQDSFESLVKESVDVNLINTFFEELSAIFSDSSNPEDGDNYSSYDEDDGKPLTPEEISDSKKRMGLANEDEENVINSVTFDGEEGEMNSTNSLDTEATIDLDAEDPAALAALDTRLASHFRLLFTSRALKRKQRLKKLFPKDESARSRVFSLISVLIRTLRLTNSHTMLMDVACRIVLLSLSLEPTLSGYSLCKRKIDEIYGKQVLGVLARSVKRSVDNIKVAKKRLSDLTHLLESKFMVVDEIGEFPHHTDVKYLSHLVPLLVSVIESEGVKGIAVVQNFGKVLAILVRTWCCSALPAERFPSAQFATLLVRLHYVDKILEVIMSITEETINKPLLMTIITAIVRESNPNITKQSWRLLRERLKEHSFLGADTFVKYEISEQVIQSWMQFLYQGVKMDEFNLDVIRRDIAHLVWNLQLRKRVRATLRIYAKKIFGKNIIKKPRHNEMENSLQNTLGSEDLISDLPRQKAPVPVVRKKERNIRDLVRQEAAKRRAEGWKPGDYYHSEPKRPRTNLTK